eukprot:4967574-Amphidinium_carterae.2
MATSSSFVVVVVAAVVVVSLFTGFLAQASFDQGSTCLGCHRMRSEHSKRVRLQSAKSKSAPVRLTSGKGYSNAVLPPPQASRFKGQTSAPVPPPSG